MLVDWRSQHRIKKYNQEVYQEKHHKKKLDFPPASLPSTNNCHDQEANHNSETPSAAKKHIQQLGQCRKAWRLKPASLVSTNTSNTKLVKGYGEIGRVNQKGDPACYKVGFAPFHFKQKKSSCE